MSREMIDFSKKFLLQHASEWNGTLVPRAWGELALLLVWAVAGLRSRLDQGRRRGLAAISKKSLATWQHGNIFFGQFLKFPDFQSISLFQKWRKFAFSKAPPFDFPPKISDS